jgi:hypothetical protein
MAIMWIASTFGIGKAIVKSVEGRLRAGRTYFAATLDVPGVN